MEDNYLDHTWLGSHNAFSNKNEGWHYFQQLLSLDEQFEYGVRCFLIDIHWYDYNSGTMCFPKNKRKLAMMHGDNIFLNTIVQRIGEPDTFKSFLVKVKKWMEHTTDPITIVLESYSGTTGGIELAKLLTETKLDKHLFSPGDYGTVGGWPSITWMNRSNKKLVIFSSNINDGVFHDATYLNENHWELKTNPGGGVLRRAHMKNMPVLFNHFPSFSFDLSYANFNTKERITARLLEYIKVTKTSPNFIVLNFVDDGDGLMVVTEYDQ